MRLSVTRPSPPSLPIRSAIHVPVVAIDRGGVVTMVDGSAVRVLELTPRTSIGVGPSDHESLLAGLTNAVQQLAPGEGLQWYVEARPVRHAELLATAGEPWSSGDAGALALLAEADRGSVARQAGDPATIERGTYLVLRETAPRRRVARRIVQRILHGERQRLLHQSLVRADVMRAVLDAIDMRPRLLDGPGVSRLLLRRIHSGANPPLERRIEVVGSLDPERDLEQATAAAVRLLDHLRGAAVDFSDERIVQIGGDLEQTIYVGGRPSGTTFDWLAPLLSIEQPYVLVVHVRAREDAEPELGIYQTIREPGPGANPVRLATVVDAVVRESAAATGARIDRGEFIQQALWRSTLPLALDDAGITHRVDARSAAESLPAITEGCGSPGGMPLAHGPRGTVERLDPWDVDHPHAGIVVAGAGAARTVFALTIIARLAMWGSQAPAAVVAVDFDGWLAGGCAGLGTAARVVEAASPADVLEAAGAQASESLTVLDATGAADRLSVAGAAAAMLADATGLVPDDPLEDAPPGLGTLVIAGAEQLLADSSGVDWLRQAAIRARREGTCVVAFVASLLPLARAGILSALPVRLLLRHDEADVAALRETLGLSNIEAGLLPRLEEDAAAAPAALWLNGNRGRAAVRLIPIPDPLPAR